jgi:hypothetical protein
MSEPITEAMRLRVRQWAAAETVLQSTRDLDIRRADTVAAIASMSGLFLDARRRLPLRLESGLVEQQRWFRRIQAR